MPSDARIAFITDALPSLVGAEKVLFTALELFPSADIFTLVYNRQLFTGTPLADREIRTSPLDRLPLAHTHHRALFPLMPAAVASFNLSDYDIVVSFNYAVAHGVRVPAGARHVSYTYTPMRYAWNNLNIRGERAPENPLVRLLFSLFRNWDRRAARRVHEFAAISQSIAARIQRAYGRHAQIIHPPVDVNRFLPGDQRGGDYFVSLSRLVPHKRLDILIAAFNELRLPLLIIGEGPELPRLQQMASANICFAGYLPDPEVGRSGARTQLRQGG